jgi:hypothetical protein
MSAHWAAKYIGRSPDAIGYCWGLLRLIYADFGIQVPEVRGLSRENAEAVAAGVRGSLMEDWDEVPYPVEGCAVGMNLRDNGEIHHVGVFTHSDDGRVVHAWGTHNVIAETQRSLRLKGFKVIKFYMHKSWRT